MSRRVTTTTTRNAARGARLGLTIAALALLTTGASATDTQWWIGDAPSDYAKAEARGLVVRPDGTIGLGPEARSTRDDSLEVIWAVQPLPDGSVALGGEHGRIDRWTESGGIKPWVRLADGQVLALAFADGQLVAGTAPGGRVYRVGLKGDTALIARTGERYVWGLAPAGKGSWWAASGTRGRLLKIEGGRARIVLDTDESNLVSLIPDGKGGAYSGGDSHGRVFHVTEAGKAGTVLDASEDEIRALALGADGALWAAALSATAVASEDEDEGPKPVKSSVSGGRATVYRVVPDSMSFAAWSAPQSFVFALLASKDGILAASGNRGAIYRIERPNAATLLLAVPQGQVTALAYGTGGTVYAAMSNPGALWRPGPGNAGRGELISAVNDARRIARFGRIRWRGDAKGAKVELFTRSGNTDSPDTTWSAWTGGATDPDGRRIESAPARYLQWKLGLAGGTPRIESVEAAWREQNLPPRLDDLVVAPQGAGFREGELTPRSESVTQTLPGGQKVEYTMPSPTGPQALRALPMWAHGIRTLQWRGSDPNGDQLSYKVEVKREDGGDWILVGDDLDANTFSWDTNGMPDGRYRVRVTATDAPSNAVGEERTDQILSEPFTVDNTPPSITRFDARPEDGAIAIEGQAEDGASALSKIEVSVDNDAWRPVTPEGGLTDAREETFRARLPDVAKGEHTVGLRVTDLAGNATLRATHLTVARGK